jgi:hypothetical protein
MTCLEARTKAFGKSVWKESRGWSVTTWFLIVIRSIALLSMISGQTLGVGLRENPYRPRVETESVLFRLMLQRTSRALPLNVTKPRGRLN